jgi:hypothetical protein
MQCKKLQQRKPKSSIKIVIDTFGYSFNRKKLKVSFRWEKGEGKFMMIFFSASTEEEVVESISN